MEPKSEVQDVYAEHGCAMAEAQLLERYIRYLEVAVREFTQSDSFDAKLAGVSKQPLGTLIENLASVPSLNVHGPEFP